MRLQDLVDEIDLPPTRVAEGAWDTAHRRVRRRRAGAFTAAAVAVVAVYATVHGLTAGDGSAPDNVPSTPVPSLSDSRIVTPGMPSPRLYDADTFERLTQTPISPPADATSLSSSPIAYAKLAMTPAIDSTEVFLLGPDETWRQLDPPLEALDDGGGRFSSPLRTTSLSPDATKLALPQTSSVVVVDLTNGSHATYPVPGRNLTYATWLGDTRVFVGNELRTTGWEVELDTGAVTESPFGPSTARTPGGQLLTWDTGQGLESSQLRWDDGTYVATNYNNSANPHPMPPLVNDDVVVGAHASYRTGLGLPMLQHAIVVLDRRTGNPVAYLPTGNARGDGTTLLGWQDDRIVLGLFPPYLPGTEQAPEVPGTHTVATWDWRTKTLEPLVTVTGHHVAWGRGW